VAGSLNRRQVLRGVAATGVAAATTSALAACGTDTPASSAAAPATSTASESSAPPAAPPAAGAGGTPLLATSAVPVGGAAVSADGAVVVAQPTTGKFVAFSTTCTHSGCKVAVGQGLSLICPCHGSVFNAATGAATKGPAQDPLAATAVTVKDGSVVAS
jgi:Rieske Fe-S protein